MSLRLKDELRHAGVGLLLGLLGVVFGIFWAVHLTVNHESVHKRLLAAEASSIEGKFVINPAPGEGGHEGHGGQADGHSAHSGHDEGPSGHSAHPDGAGVEESRSDIAQKAPEGGHYGSPDMEEAHRRLSRAHVHAMGLGMLSIAVSLMLAFVPAPARAKTLAAACVGTGAVFFPLSWILMGMRTTALGAEGAAASVVPMVGLSVMLVGLGLVLALVYLLRWLLFRD